MTTKLPILNFLLIIAFIFPIPFYSISTSHFSPSTGGAVKVEVVEKNGSFQLLRGGKPYFIAGAGGSNYLDALKAAGGNSIRTWGTKDAQRVLDEAHKRGLTVTMGLEVIAERHGFNYDDSAAVSKQFNRVKQEVLKYKDHPALLMWGLGNELNLQYSNVKVWDAVNDIAKMIHEIDPNHPTSTMLAGLKQKEATLIQEKAPEIDVLAINAYGELTEVPKLIREYGWQGPYIVSEWGPTGHWECTKTEWGAPIEETSHEKAKVYKSRYELTIGEDKERCLGSYVFLWGQKQERTPTWYGIFTEAGEETEVADVMHELWSGRSPENKAPKIEYLKLDGKNASNSIYLNANKTYKANTSIIELDNDKLEYYWELLPESTDLGVGGDHESRPEALGGKIKGSQGKEISITAPEKEGAYRLFIYAKDGNNNVATGNIPFYVRKGRE